MTTSLARALGLCLLGFATAARGAVFHIGCTGASEDDADLSAAIDFANDEQDFPGPDTIVLATGCQYTLGDASNFWYGPNALPPIQSTIIIVGNGAKIVRDPALPADTSHAFRLFYVSGGLDGELPAGDLTLRDLTLAGGLAKGGDSRQGGGGAGMGGAIFNQGQLTLDSVTFTANTAQGGNTYVGSSPSGGGMGQDAQDTTGGGFGGTLPGGPYGGRGAPEGGGGGFTTNNGNAGSQGLGGGLGGLGGGAGSPGDGGDGAGFGQQLAGGDFGAGGASGGGIGGGGGQGFVAGSGGFGGGGGYGNIGGAGGFGAGGGAGGVGSGSAGIGGGTGATDGSSTSRGGGGAGMGGAIFNHTGTATLTNCTLAGNSANGGVTSSNDGAGNGSGLGAAIFNLNGAVSISFSTIAQNLLGQRDGTPASSGLGDGSVFSLAYGNKIQDGTESVATLTITNSIFYGTAEMSGAGNNDVVNDVVAGTSANNPGNTATMLFSGANVIGAIHNLATLDPGSTTPLTTDPVLGALASNNAPNAPQTMSIGDGSSALNAAIGNCPDVDERGAPRPANGACDIGAYEAQPTDDWIFFNGFD